MREYDVTPQRITPLLSLSGREFEEAIEKEIARSAPHGPVRRPHHRGADRPVNNDAVIEEARNLPPARWSSCSSPGSRPRSTAG